jgi:hypothetical protein
LQRARDLFGALCFTNFSVDPGMDEALTIIVSVWMRFQPATSFEHGII